MQAWPPPDRVRSLRAVPWYPVGKNSEFLMESSSCVSVNIRTSGSVYLMRLASSALLPAILLQLTTRDLQLLCALAWLHCPLICVELFTESWEQLLLNCLLRGSGDDRLMEPVGVLNAFGLKEEMWLFTEVLCTSVGSLASERMLNLLLRSISYDKKMWI